MLNLSDRKTKNQQTRTSLSIWTLGSLATPFRLILERAGFVCGLHRGLYYDFLYCGICLVFWRVQHHFVIVFRSICAVFNMLLVYGGADLYVGAIRFHTINSICDHQSDWSINTPGIITFSSNCVWHRSLDWSEMRCFSCGYFCLLIIDMDTRNIWKRPTLIIKTVVRKYDGSPNDWEHR